MALKRNNLPYKIKGEDLNFEVQEFSSYSNSWSGNGKSYLIRIGKFVFARITFRYGAITPGIQMAVIPTDLRPKEGIVIRNGEARLMVANTGLITGYELQSGKEYSIDTVWELR